MDHLQPFSMQAADRGQSWRIHVTAKARNLNFRFRFRFNAAAASFTPTNWTLSSCRLSIVLKLRKFVFRIVSKPSTTPQPIKYGRGGFIRSKFMKIVRIFRARFSKKNRPNVVVKRESHLPCPKDQIGIGFGVVGFLAFLAQLIISNKLDRKGLIMMVASVAVFVASLLFKKFKTVKLTILAAFALVATVAINYYLFFHFHNNDWDYMEWSWSAWNKIANH